MPTGAPKTDWVECTMYETKVIVPATGVGFVLGFSMNAKDFGAFRLVFGSIEELHQWAGQFIEKK